jgi:hypothetical protein
MKKVSAMIMFLVALVALSSSAEIKFSSSDFEVTNVSVVKNRVLGFIAKDPVRNLVWTGHGNIDLNSKSLTTGDIPGSRKVDFDKRKDPWFARGDSGLTHKVLSSGLINRYLVDTCCYFVYCDNENNQVVAGTSVGVVIYQLDASGNPVSSSIALSGTIHQVFGFHLMKVALNTARVFITLDGKSWKTYDSTNSPISGNYCYGTVDGNGNFYVTTCKSTPTFRVISGIAVFDYVAQTWSRIDMSSVDDSVSGMSQVRVDNRNQLYCVFPVTQAARPGNPWSGWLVKMDLASGAIEKSATDGTGDNPGLDETACGGEPALGLTEAGDIIIGGNGIIIVGNSGNPVLPRIIRSKVEYNFRFAPAKQFDVLGRLISKKTFSINQNQNSAGFYFSAYPTSKGFATVNSFNVK